MHYEVTGVEQWNEMVPVVPKKRLTRGAHPAPAN